MKKLLITGLLAGVVLSGCAGKYTITKENFSNQEKVELGQVMQEKKQEAELKIDKKRLNDEVSEKNMFFEELKRFTYVMTVKTATNTITGDAVGVSQLTAYAMDYAIKEGLKARYEKDKNSYAIIPVIENPNIKTSGCSFSIVVKSDIEKWVKDFNMFLDYTNFELKHGDKINYVESSPNKIVVYLFEFKMPSKTKYLKTMEFPFINGFVDVVISNQLAGRYYVYGNASRALVVSDWDFNTILPVALWKLKDKDVFKGLIPYTVPKNYCSQPYYMTKKNQE